MPVIRPYQVSDAHDLAELLGVLGYPTDAEETAKRLERMSSTHHTLVAVLGGRVVGFIGLISVQPYESRVPIGYILALSVSPDHQRQGLGKALLHSAEAHFFELGITDIRVNSGLHRAEAHGFYEAMGYDKTGLRFRKVLRPVS